MLGQDAEAQSWLEQALKLVPQNTDASLLLGELHHRAGRVGEAVSTYEAALKYAPNEPVLNDKLGQWRKDATVRAGFLRVSRGALQRALPGTGRRDDRATRGRDARRDVLAGRRGVDDLSDSNDHRGPLHGGTVPRHHAVAGVGRRVVRRHHSNSDTRRTRPARGTRPHPGTRVRSRSGGHDWRPRCASVAERRARLDAPTRRRG